MSQVTVDIKGYRQLSDDEQRLINELKELGIDLGKYIEDLEARPPVDKRWVAIGKTHMQQGLMALIRSVAQPETF